MEKISFYDVEFDEELEFFVVETTKFNGQDYLLVTEEEDDDSLAYIMHQVNVDETEELVYEMVEDDALIDALTDIFAELLSDADIDLTTED